MMLLTHFIVEVRVSFQKSGVAEAGKVNHVKGKDGFRQSAVRRGRADGVRTG